MGAALGAPSFDETGRPVSPYKLHIFGPQISLDDLERLGRARRVEVRLALLELVIDQVAMEKIKEFTGRVLETRKEQMAKLPSPLRIPCN